MKFLKTVTSALPAAVLGFLALGLTSTAVQAQTIATTNFTVTATVLASCTVSATPLPFGNYTPSAASTNSSTISVTCTNGKTYTVGLNQGLATNGTTTVRQMGITQPAGGLNYGLYQNSTLATNWGNAAGSWESGTGNGTVQQLTVYGQIPAAQYVTAGSYTDTITATVTY
jgi:spore coat protein U-like protein